MNVDQVVSALLAVCGFMITFMISRAVENLEKMEASISELNLKMEKIVVRVESHENRLNRLEII